MKGNKRFGKNIRLGVVLVLIGLMLTACGTKDSSKEKFVFKLGHAADENNTWHLGAMKFAQLVAEKSGGRVEIKVYPNEQLGKEVDNITSIQAGTADMVLSGESLQNWAPIVGIMSTPYLIESSEYLQRVVNGEVGKKLEKEIYDKAGLVVLTYFERGPRYLTSNRPINSVNDLKGLKLRIPNVPLFVEVWNYLGAKPIPMAFSEVFTSLQQNTIEAQENPIALCRSGGFYEAQRYLNNTAHVRSWIYMLIGKDQWNELPEDLQQVMREAAEETHVYEHQLFLEQEGQIMKELTSEGRLTFVNTDQESFRVKCEEYYESSLSPELYELYQEITALK